MALGAREVLLVIRASDQASSVLSRLSKNMSSLDADAMAAAKAQMQKGTAIMGMGAAIAGMGAAGLKFYNDSINAAKDYENAARLAFTQVDNGKTSLKDLETMGLQVGTAIPVALGDTQKALYDIFSTMDVSTAQSKTLLTEFSKAAVGGQTDVSTAAVGTMRVMNAFKMGVGDVNKANDIMFQLVRKGVGTYDNFNAALGKVSPSAVRAGQDLQTTAGILAFLTRNGLSASMAATSASRALDAVSNPKFQTNMKAIGLSVQDAQGNFKPMMQIMQEVSDKFKDMTAPEKAQALTDLFKGAGNNVQAMRFFNLVVNNDKAFNGMVGDMQKSGGAMQNAYNIMLKSPQQQAQLLQNRMQALRIEIGQKLLPIKVALMGVLTKLLGLWTALPGPVKNAIVIFGAVLSVLMVLAGIAIMAAGAFMILNGALVMLGTTLAAVFWPVTLVVLAIMAIIAAIWALIKYHKQIWDFIKMVWGAISDFVVGVWNVIVDKATKIWSAIVDAVRGPMEAVISWAEKRWNDFSSFFSNLWDQLVGPIKSGWDELSKEFQKGVAYINDRLNDFVGGLKDAWKNAQPIVKFMGDMWSSVYNNVLKPYIGMIVSILKDLWGQWQHVWGHLVAIWKDSMPFLKAFWVFFVSMLQDWWNVIKGVFMVAMQLFIGIWNGFIDVLKLVWDAVKNAFGGILDIIGGTIGLVIDLVTGHWGKAWENFVKILRGVWGLVKAGVDLIAAPFVWLWDIFGGIFHAIDTLLGVLITSFLGFFDTVFHFMGPLLKFLGQLVGNIIGIFGDAGMWLLQAGGDLLKGLWNGITGVWTSFVDYWKGILNYVIDFFKNLFGIHSPSTVFADFGIMILQGLWNGLQSFIGNIWNFFKSIFTTVVGILGNVGSWLWNTGWSILRGLWNGISNGAGDVWNFFRNLPSQILGVLGDGASWLLGVGKNLLQGLWNGISGAAGWLWDQIKGWANSVKNGVLNFFGIHSPSRVFADIGKNLMLGLAGGINTHGTTAVKAATAAAGAITDAFQNGLNVNVGTSSLSSYAAGQIGSPSVTTGLAGVMTQNGMAGAARGGVTVPITINTQEINPLQHAAELGMLISTRV